MKWRLNLKKIVLFLLICFLLAGCKQETGSKDNVYKIYYLNRDTTHIETIQYTAVAKNPQELAEELLQQMSKQVEKVGYQPAIWGFSIKSCEVAKGQITLNVSEEYKMLESVKEVLIRAAIVKTLTQIDGIDFVTMQINGQNLLDNLGNTIGVMSAGTFIDNTGEDMKKYEQVTLDLYFTDEEGNKLVKVNRTLRYNTNIALEKLVVEQLIVGPIEQKNGKAVAYPTLNPQTKIISVSIKDSICYVNLSNTFLNALNNVSADAVIYSLVNSLVELPSVLKVQIAIEGETEINYREKYNLSTLFEARYDMVQFGNSIERK